MHVVKPFDDSRLYKEKSKLVLADHKFVYFGGKQNTKFNVKFVNLVDYYYF